MEFRQAIILVFITIGALSLMIGVFPSKFMYGVIYTSDTVFSPSLILMFFFWIIAGLIHITGTSPRWPWK